MRRLVTLMLLLGACAGGTTPPTSSASTSTTAGPVPTTSPPVSTTTSTGSLVMVFYSTDSSTTCAEVAGFERVIPSDDDPIRAAFEQLLTGPTAAEAATGVWSWFGPATVGLLEEVTLAAGRLTLDFANFATVIPNASSSCGSAALLAQLTATAFQFDEVDSVAFSFDGDCAAFGEFLQMGCVEIDRVDWSATQSGYRFEASEDLLPPSALPGSDEAAGSGCSPGEGPLPDGIWFGMARAGDATTVQFDLACFFVGEAANAAAAEDGVDEIPVPNDYYIRNENPTTRMAPVGAEAVVHSLGASIDDGYERISWSEWLTAREGFMTCPGDSCLVWLFVNGGAVTEVVEQYTP